jgi:hypothetical protein
LHFSPALFLFAPVSFDFYCFFAAAAAAAPLHLNLNSWLFAETPSREAE